MHEMALAEGIVAVVLDVADGRHVERVYLQVGALLRVAPESLHFAFQLLTDDTPAAGAALVIEEVPACWRCQHCAVDTYLELPPVQCPACGASTPVLAAGDALLVDAIQLTQGITIRRQTVPADALLQEHCRQHAPHAQMLHAHERRTPDQQQ